MTSTEEQLESFRNGELEKAIRNGLEQREKTMYGRYIESHPEFVKEVDAARLEAGKSIKDTFKQGAIALAEEEKKRIDKEIEGYYRTGIGELSLLKRGKERIDEELKDLDGEIEKLVAGEPMFKQIADMVSIEQLNKYAGGHYKASYPETLEALKMASTSTPSEQAGTIAKALELAKNSEAYMKLNDIFVNRLVEIAKEKGTGHALEDKTIYSAKKWLFPTPETYMEHIDAGGRMTGGSIALVSEAFKAGAAAAMGSDEEAALSIEMIGKIIGSAFEYQKKFVNKIDYELAKQEIAEMYGNNAKQSPALSGLEAERARILEIYAAANKQ